MMICFIFYLVQTCKYKKNNNHKRFLRKNGDFFLGDKIFKYI